MVTVENDQFIATLPLLDDTENLSPRNQVPSESDSLTLQDPTVRRSWPNKLNWVAATALSVLATIGPAQALANQDSSATGRHSLGPVQPEIARVSSGWDTACGNPGFFSPKAKQIASMLCFINSRRNSQYPLVEDPALALSATQKALNIIRDKDFSHYAGHEDNPTIFPDFPPGISADPEESHIGENLAWGDAALGGPLGTYAAWWASPTHHEVMDNPSFTKVGIAVVHTAVHSAVYDGPAAIWVAHFAGPHDSQITHDDTHAAGEAPVVSPWG